MESITIELNSTEQAKLISILQTRYKESINLFEISAIKSILQKLNVKVEDWTPPLSKDGAL